MSFFGAAQRSTRRVLRFCYFPGPDPLKTKNFVLKHSINVAATLSGLSPDHRDPLPIPKKSKFFLFS